MRSERARLRFGRPKIAKTAKRRATSYGEKGRADRGGSFFDGTLAQASGGADFGRGDRARSRGGKGVEQSEGGAKEECRQTVVKQTKSGQQLSIRTLYKKLEEGRSYSKVWGTNKISEQ